MYVHTCKSSVYQSFLIYTKCISSSSTRRGLVGTRTCISGPYVVYISVWRPSLTWPSNKYVFAYLVFYSWSTFICLCCCTVCDCCFDLFIFRSCFIVCECGLWWCYNFVELCPNQLLSNFFSCLDFQRWFGVVDFPIGDRTVGLCKSACWWIGAHTFFSFSLFSLTQFIFFSFSLTMSLCYICMSNIDFVQSELCCVECGIKCHSTCLISPSSVEHWVCYYCINLILPFAEGDCNVEKNDSAQLIKVNFLMDKYLDHITLNDDCRVMLNEEGLDADINYLNSTSSYSRPWPVSGFLWISASQESTLCCPFKLS